MLPFQNLPGDEHGCFSSTYEGCNSIYLVRGEVDILLLPEEYQKAACPTYKFRFPKKCLMGKVLASPIVHPKKNVALRPIFLFKSFIAVEVTKLTRQIMREMVAT